MPPSARHSAAVRQSPATPRHARSHHRRKVVRRAGAGALAVTLFAGTGVALAYNDIQGNVDRHDIADLLGDRPTVPGSDGLAVPEDLESGHALNILVMGSDVRAEGSGEAGAVEGMRSDTTMIAHVSADRSRVDVVSIPRDTLVEIPSCTLPDGQETSPRTEAMFNSAFALGGQTGDVGAAAACTIRTVELLTGVFIDDFAVVDFNGFTTMVDALDGVPMYIPDPVDDPAAELQLAAGCQLLNGEKALGLARARKSLPGGSDISRIGRQQELVAAIAREALNKNLLTDLPALYRFLDAATDTLTTGEDLGSLPTLAGLANSLRGIDPSDINFATMPFDWAGNRVTPAESAEEMWTALQQDEPIDATLTGTGEEPEEPAEESPGTGAPSGSPDAPEAETPDGEATSPTQPEDDATTPEPEVTPSCTRADV